MMLILRIVLIFGFCLATLGAAGFADPVEAAAPWMLGIGMGSLAVSGFMLRRLTHEAAHAEQGSSLSLEGLIAEVSALSKRLDTLAADGIDLDRAAICERVNELLHGPFFEIGSRNEAYIRALGNADYVSVWDGFAIAERRLARSWSLATDGHLEEARAELPAAARHLRRASATGRIDR